MKTGLSNSEKRGKVSGKPIGHYKCPHCRQFHLTSKKNKRRAATPERIRKREEKVKDERKESH